AQGSALGTIFFQFFGNYSALKGRFIKAQGSALGTWVGPAMLFFAHLEPNNGGQPKKRCRLLQNTAPNFFSNFFLYTLA
ncbi:MAG: hypothetical protein DRR19_31275, partial [Candidatus Parabeggiatoa sp. nov. 1]